MPEPRRGRPGPVRRPAGRAEPSWGRVLASTVKLAVLRRLRASPAWRRRHASGSRRWHARRRWRLATLALALAGAAVTVLWLAGGLAGRPSRAAAGGPRWPAIGGGRGAGPGGRLDRGSGERQRDRRVRSGHVRGAAGAGRRRGPADAAAVCRGQPARRRRAGDLPVAGGQLAGRYAPALIASFGSGGNRVEVRAVQPGGEPAYRAALRADLAARRAAGFSCSGTRASGSPGRAPRNCGRVRWIPGCWPRWRRWRRSSRSG